MAGPMVKVSDGGEVLAGCVAVPLMIPVVVVIDAVLLSRLWMWFVIPTFPSAPHLSLPIAAGLSLVVGWARGARPDPQEDERNVLETVKRTFNRGIVLPLLLLLIGWVIKSVWL